MDQPKKHASLDLCTTKVKQLKYKKLVKIDLCPTRFVKYEDLGGFGIEYFQIHAGEFADLLNFNNQRAYYPDLVRIFYANLGGGPDVQGTAVKGEYMTLTPAQIGKIFHLSNYGIRLKDVEFKDEEIIKDIFIDGTLPKGKQIFFNSLTPKGKVVSKVILHNILPKTNSMHYLSMDHLKLLYVIFYGCQFNWARFLFDQLIKEHTSCIPYGALITRIFEFYKFVLTNELDETYCKEYIDKATLKRMKLVDSEIGTPFASSSKRPQISPVKSYALERKILEEVQMVGAMIKDLTKRLEVVENKVEEIHAKTCEKVGSNQLPKKNEEQEGVSKRRRKVCVSKGKAPRATPTPTPTTPTEEPFEIEE